MTNTQKFIEDAIAGEWQGVKLAEGVYDNQTIELALLDPLAWHARAIALGHVPKDPQGEMRCTSEKCDARLCSYGGYKDPKQQAIWFMQLVMEGCTIDDALGKIAG